MNSSCGGADVGGAADGAHLDRPAADLLSRRGLLDGPGQVVGAEHHDLDRGVGVGGRLGPGDELQEVEDERRLDLLIVELPGAHRRDQQGGDRRQQADLPDQAAAKGGSRSSVTHNRAHVPRPRTGP